MVDIPVKLSTEVWPVFLYLYLERLVAVAASIMVWLRLAGWCVAVCVGHGWLERLWAVIFLSSVRRAVGKSSV